MFLFCFFFFFKWHFVPLKISGLELFWYKNDSSSVWVYYLYLWRCITSSVCWRRRQNFGICLRKHGLLTFFKECINSSKKGKKKQYKCEPNSICCLFAVYWGLPRPHLNLMCRLIIELQMKFTLHLLWKCI